MIRVIIIAAVLALAASAYAADYGARRYALEERSKRRSLRSASIRRRLGVYAVRARESLRCDHYDCARIIKAWRKESRK